MWPEKPIEFIALDEDRKGIHFGLWKGVQIVSVISLFINEDEAQFRKFATALSEQSNGYGTLLMRHLMTYAENLKVKKIWCNARADKTSFYEKFGMRQTSKSFIKGGINYIIMEKIFADVS